MKKTYIAPTMEIFRTESEQILAESIMTLGFNDSPSIDDPGDVLSRRDYGSRFSRRRRRDRSYDPEFEDEEEDW